jgi:hypothetical protein
MNLTLIPETRWNWRLKVRIAFHWPFTRYPNSPAVLQIDFAACGNYYAHRSAGVDLFLWEWPFWYSVGCD